MADADRISPLILTTDNFRGLLNFQFDGKRKLNDIIHQNPSILWSKTYRINGHEMSLITVVFVWRFPGFMGSRDDFLYGANNVLYKINDILNKYAEDYNLTADEEYAMRMATFENNSNFMYREFGKVHGLLPLQTLVKLSPHGMENIDFHMVDIITGLMNSPLFLNRDFAKFVDYLIHNSSYGIALLLLEVEVISYQDKDYLRSFPITTYKSIIDYYRTDLKSGLSPEVIAWTEDPRIYQELTDHHPENARIIKDYKETHRDELADYYTEREQELMEEVYETLRREDGEPNNLPLLMSSILPQQSRVYYERQ